MQMTRAQRIDAAQAYLVLYETVFQIEGCQISWHMSATEKDQWVIDAWWTDSSGEKPHAFAITLDLALKRLANPALMVECRHHREIYGPPDECLPHPDLSWFFNHEIVHQMESTPYVFPYLDKSKPISALIADAVDEINYQHHFLLTKVTNYGVTLRTAELEFTRDGIVTREIDVGITT